MNEFILKLDYYGLLSLHKALLEAKFHADPENREVSGSPLVADIYIQVREQLIKSEKSEQWKEWFRLKNRPDYRSRAILRMKQSWGWQKAAVEEKKRIAGNFLAPFFYSEAELKEAVAEADQIFVPAQHP